MRKKLMDILCCPVCKGDLELNIVSENEEEVLEGSLYCSNCDEHYEIHDGIPDMLPKQPT